MQMHRYSLTCRSSEEDLTRQQTEKISEQPTASCNTGEWNTGNHILNPSTLQRITNSRLYGNQYSVADVMNDLVKGIFDADISGNVNVYRQMLQTSFVKGTSR
jgi:hypothetical protein